jgi:hypothetical protein
MQESELDVSSPHAEQKTWIHYLTGSRNSALTTRITVIRRLTPKSSYHSRMLSFKSREIFQLLESMKNRLKPMTEPVL